MTLSRFFQAAALLAGFLCAAANSSAQGPAPTPGATGYHLAATWKIGGEGGWDYLAFDPEAQRLYITRTDRVQVIDAATGRLVGEALGLEGGHGTALVPGELHRGFATSGKSDTVLMFDLQTLKPIGEPVAVGKKPDAILYCPSDSDHGKGNPALQRVFVFNGESHDASVLDPATGKVVATIPLGGAPEFGVADGLGKVFVNLEDKSEIAVIDMVSNTVIRRFPLAPGEEPTGLSLDPAHRRLFAGCHNQKLIACDADGGQNILSVAIGKGVDATAFDPGTGRVFASCGDGTLTIALDGAAGGTQDLGVLGVITTQPGARTMALDPSTHAVYLAAADFEPAPSPAPGQPHARPKPVPGSFVILKFVP